MRVAGLMSGTSLDGIDVAIVDIERRAGRLATHVVAFETIAYERNVRDALGAALPPNPGTVRDACVLNALIGGAFAHALLRVLDRADIPSTALELIGSHGQTLYHLPTDDGRSPFARSTLQLGDASVIAQRSGVTCVGDFRTADVAAGGQGAPLVSYVDLLLLSDATEHRVAVNIGGIANVTILPAHCHPADVRAFDTGPGNMLIDACARIAGDGKLVRDDEGRLAAAGEVDVRLLDELLGHPYFSRRGPKTTGREEFGERFASHVWDRGRQLGTEAADIVATVTELTGRTIAAAVPADCDRIIASGGGTHNPSLMAAIARNLSRDRQVGSPRVSLSDDYGLPADAKEAIAFAVLAYETIHARPNNSPPATGAARAVVLGKIAPGENFRRLMRRVLR